MKKTLLTVASIVVLAAILLTGCQNPSETSALKEGSITLAVNPEIRVNYDEDALVTSIEGLNVDGESIVSLYPDFVGKECDVVLADLPYGQEYFENLVYENCGISDIDEYQEYVELKTSDVISEVMTLMSEYELTDLEKMFMGEIEFSDAADPNELLAYLSEAMKEDFPDIGSIAYDMVELPGELNVCSNP